MAGKRRNHNLRHIRQDYSYTTQEVAELLGIEVSTVRRWVRLEGLKRIPNTKPHLIFSGVLIAFLEGRKAELKRTCTDAELYCFKCREPGFVEQGSVTTQPTKNQFIRLMARCACCSTKMSKLVKPANWQENHPLYLSTQPSVREHEVQQQSQSKCSLERGEQLCLSLTL